MLELFTPVPIAESTRTYVSVLTANGQVLAAPPPGPGSSKRSPLH